MAFAVFEQNKQTSAYSFRLIHNGAREALRPTTLYVISSRARAYTTQHVTNTRFFSIRETIFYAMMSGSGFWNFVEFFYQKARGTE